MAQAQGVQEALKVVSGLPFFEVRKVIDLLGDLEMERDKERLRMQLVDRLAEVYEVDRSIISKMSAASLYHFFTGDVNRHIALLKAIDQDVLKAADRIEFKSDVTSDTIEIYKDFNTPLLKVRMSLLIYVDYSKVSNSSAGLYLFAIDEHGESHIMYGVNLAKKEGATDYDLLVRYLNMVEAMSDP